MCCDGRREEGRGVGGGKRKGLTIVNPRRNAQPAGEVAEGLNVNEMPTRLVRNAQNLRIKSAISTSTKRLAKTATKNQEEETKNVRAQQTTNKTNNTNPTGCVYTTSPKQSERDHAEHVFLTYQGELLVKTGE